MADAAQKVGGQELPTRIPVFPLVGVLLLPGRQLPLNMFEPRYLEMTRDAMAGDRIIGMVQPKDPMSREYEPEIYDIGCAGRIIQFAETPDNRFLISLQGICRFRLIEEPARLTPYRQAIVDFRPFGADLSAKPPSDIDRNRLLAALRGYLDAGSIESNAGEIERAPTGTLVDSLAMVFPFEPGEKQALLEAPDLSERARILTTLMEMALAQPADGRDGAPVQ